jgi:hypothetical protein
VHGRLPAGAWRETPPPVRVGSFSGGAAACPAGAALADLPAVDCVASRIAEPATSAADALRLAREAVTQFGPPGRHPLAVPLNTRGFRLEAAKQYDDALLLFVLAAELDPSYGIPRFNAARAHARRGDVQGSLRYLRELKQLGWVQQFRMRQAFRDQAFQSAWSDPGLEGSQRRGVTLGAGTGQEQIVAMQLGEGSQHVRRGRRGGQGASQPGDEAWRLQVDLRPGCRGGREQTRELLLEQSALQRRPLPGGVHRSDEGISQRRFGHQRLPQDWNRRCRERRTATATPTTSQPSTAPRKSSFW